MKSAYLSLGLPGNASLEDIQSAYKAASARFTKEYLAEKPEAVTRLQELRDAFKILSDPQMRAAHDRKLQSIPNTSQAPKRLAMEPMPAAWYTKPLNVMALVMVVLFASGGYMSYTRQQTAKALAAQELAQKKLEAENEARLAAEEAARNAERARMDAIARSNESQLRSESIAVGRIAAATEVAQQNAFNRQIEADRREAQRKEAIAKAQERQAASEARQRVASDQQRIRELCYQQYRKTQC